MCIVYTKHCGQSEDIYHTHSKPYNYIFKTYLLFVTNHAIIMDQVISVTSHIIEFGLHFSFVLGHFLLLLHVFWELIFYEILLNSLYEVSSRSDLRIPSY